MHKETLRGHLHNKPLVQAIKQKMQINDTRKNLYNTLNIANETGMSGAVCTEIEDKCTMYNKIYKGYSNLIEDTWEISWQNEEIIVRYIDWRDDDINKLPEQIKIY